MWIKISNGTVVVIQRRGSLFSLVLVGISVVKHTCVHVGKINYCSLSKPMHANYKCAGDVGILSYC